MPVLRPPLSARELQMCHTAETVWHICKWLIINRGRGTPPGGLSGASDPGLLDDAEDQGDEVDDEAVEDGDEAYFDAAGKDVGCDVIVAG